MASKKPRYRQPPHVPSKETRAKVRLYAVAHFSQERIADLLGIDAKTLRKHYRRDLDVAKDEINARLIGKTIEMAMDGHPTMLIWAMKNLCGWSDTQTVRHEDQAGNRLSKLGFKITFPNGGPGVSGVEVSSDIAPHGAAASAAA